MPHVPREPSSVKRQFKSCTPSAYPEPGFSDQVIVGGLAPAGFGAEGLQRVTAPKKPQILPV